MRDDSEKATTGESPADRGSPLVGTASLPMTTTHIELDLRRQLAT